MLTYSVVGSVKCGSLANAIEFHKTVGDIFQQIELDAAHNWFYRDWDRIFFSFDTKVNPEYYMSLLVMAAEKAKYNATLTINEVSKRQLTRFENNLFVKG